MSSAKQNLTMIKVIYTYEGIPESHMLTIFLKILPKNFAYYAVSIMLLG